MDQLQLRHSLWARLIVYYAKHMPEKLTMGVISEILDKYQNKEKGLESKLEKKYFASLPSSVTAEEVESVRIHFGLEDPEKSSQTEIANINFATPTCAKSLQEEIKMFALDFTSSHFNPLLALQLNDISPPIPNVRALDNISQFRTLLPIENPDHIRTVKGRKIVATNKKSIGSAVRSVKQGVSGPRLDPLQMVMNLTVKEGVGPLSFLLRLCQEKRRTSVMIRYINSIRGVCTGIIKAFDRHFNLILVDVTEEYIHRIAEKQSIPRKKRYLRQLLIRGDNVVLCWEETQGLRKKSNS